MNSKAQSVRLEFEIESLDSTRPTEEAVPDVTALAGDLQAAVANQFPGAQVRIARAEGLPLAPAIQHILVNIDWDVVKKGIEQAAASFATTQLLTLIKTKINNLSAKSVQSGAPTCDSPKL
jgi:hypothetical protein